MEKTDIFVEKSVLDAFALSFQVQIVLLEPLPEALLLVQLCYSQLLLLPLLGGDGGNRRSISLMFLVSVITKV